MPDVGPVGISVDLSDFARVADALKRGGPEFERGLTGIIHGFADDVYEGAMDNIGRRKGEGKILHFRSGRLHGAMGKHHGKLYSEIENDIFYGALWEYGFDDVSGQHHKRAWLAPALDDAGGEAGLREEVDIFIDEFDFFGVGR
jgi:hypothetical protein